MCCNNESSVCYCTWAWFGLDWKDYNQWIQMRGAKLEKGISVRNYHYESQSPDREPRILKMAGCQFEQVTDHF